MSTFQVTQALLDKGVETPTINHAPLPRYALENLDYGMTIGVAVTQKGAIYACWVAGGDNPKAFFLLSRSVDGGRTFSQPMLVIDPHDERLPYPRCTIVGTLFNDPSGRLWLFFNQSLQHFDGRSGSWYIRCDDPDAEKPVWSEPRYIWHGAILNKPVVVGDEWLLHISLWQRYHISEPFKDCFHDLDDERMAHVFSSHDRGESWQRLGGVRFPESRFDEHMLIKRRDGVLYMLGRVRDGLMSSESFDAGYTWTKPVRAGVQSVSARFCLKTLASGRVLLIKHGIQPELAPPRREQLTAFLSEDDGKTWPYALMLDERFEVSYPDADQRADGRIFITYDRNRTVDGEILLASITESDILAGELISPESFLRRVILAPGKLRKEPSL